MSSSEFDVLHVIHVASALMLIGFTFFAFAADPAKRKLTLAWGGVASLLVLLTGLRMWQAQFNFVFAGWIAVKILCWILISALAGIGFRRRAHVGLWMTLALLAAALAVTMAYVKPF
ncbi:MAG TPA: hypothetical protein VFE31_09845 [Opitutaceae bacterium]|jgi:hypothetical protein|nr:hypothetical protein [Opitutaceae bacterium]